MGDILTKEELKETDVFFDNYFDNMDLNKDLEKFYQFINNDDLNEEYEQNIKLSKIRNRNYKQYSLINILKYKDLPESFQEITHEILNLYNFINSGEILTADYSYSINISKILEKIFIKIEKLENTIKIYLEEITKRNDEKQLKFNIEYFNNLVLDEEIKKIIIKKYNDLVIFNSYIAKDMYDDVKMQKKREEYITEIFNLMNVKTVSKPQEKQEDKLEKLNKKIKEIMLKNSQEIQYLEDIIPEKSKYLIEFESFKNYYNSLIAYDDTNYEKTKQISEVLNDKDKFKNYIKYFEDKFVDEIINNQKEENFVYEKFGIKNLKNSLNYIAANYIDKLEESEKLIVEKIFNKLNSGNYDLNDLNHNLRFIVKKIWKTTTTDVYNYNPNEDYYFICSNNQFIDEKYQTILITKKSINRVDDYKDYQIGFICGYNDNILYITENEDIMSVDYDDMSDLKTPLQLEQEFINFTVCNRIALNGYKTKIQAVYFINDGNMKKYRKAVELANIYNLPLIEFRKDNQ